MILTFLTAGLDCAVLVPTEKEDTDHAVGYSLVAPTPWVTQGKTQGDRAYLLPSGCVVTMTSSCSRSADAPLDVLTKHLLIGSRHVAIEKRETWIVDGTQGLHSKLKATFEGKPFFLELFVLPKAGCVFDFTLISKSPLAANDSQQFSEFIRSFHYDTTKG